MSKPSSPEMSADVAAFFAAAIEGRADDVQHFLTKGVPVDVLDNRDIPWHRTALMRAAGHGHLEVVKILLKSGADISAPDKDFAESESGCQPIHYAMFGANIAVVEELLAAGADVNAYTTFGRTPLIKAVESNNIDAIQLLVKRGAKINLRPKRKRFHPPLFQAVIATISPVEILKLVTILLEAGADPNLTDDLDQTPLAWLAFRRDMPDEQRLPIMDVLLKAGTQLDHANQSGQTAISTCVYSLNHGVVKFLAEAGADLNRLYPAQGGTLMDVAEKRMKAAEESVARETANIERQEAAERSQAVQPDPVRVTQREGARQRAVENVRAWREMLNVLHQVNAKRSSELK